MIWIIWLGTLPGFRLNKCAGAAECFRWQRGPSARSAPMPLSRAARGGSGGTPPPPTVATSPAVSAPSAAGTRPGHRLTTHSGGGGQLQARKMWAGGAGGPQGCTGIPETWRAGGSDHPTRPSHTAVATPLGGRLRLKRPPDHGVLLPLLLHPLLRRIDEPHRRLDPPPAVGGTVRGGDGTASWTLSWSYWMVSYAVTIHILHFCSFVLLFPS